MTAKANIRTHVRFLKQLNRNIRSLRMSNRLAQSSSPYLLQHKDNPVDWFPWCDEAFEKAKLADKPIFLSVGYAACHWCHVMEHESFENDDIAAILNQHFISIKVDREERPDVDQVYMQAVQMLTGSGGWPMSVFMSHDGKPFYGGTYWPPDSRWGRPGFGQVLLAVSDAWHSKRDQIDQQSNQIVEYLRDSCRGPAPAQAPLSESVVQSARNWLLENHDRQDGGFGSAPKFPHAMDLSLLTELCHAGDDPQAEFTVRHTLDKMAAGGIYDHLGGGFARYSVDAQWLVPHFEKMLYDNALLCSCYADAARIWQHAAYEQVVIETIDYVLRDMTDAGGGFYSTEDADSEGVEGKFYVWSKAEIEQLLGTDDSDTFCEFYGVTPAGNFEGFNILNVRESVSDFCDRKGLEVAGFLSDLERQKKILFRQRCQRVRPGLDDKVLLSWNALMIAALVGGYRAVGNPDYLVAADRAIGFIQSELTLEGGRLAHTWRNGQATIDAYLDDYAYLLDAIVELFQVSSDLRYLQEAIHIAEILLEEFSDPRGGFFYTSPRHEDLVAKGKDLADSSVPSGNAMAAMGLFKLAQLTWREDFRSASQSALDAASGVMEKSPQAAGQALRVLARHLKPSREKVLILANGDARSEAWRRALAREFDPYSVSVICHESELEQLSAVCPLVRQRGLLDGQSTYFACKNSVCAAPVLAETVLQAPATPE